MSYKQKEETSMRRFLKNRKWLLPVALFAMVMAFYSPQPQAQVSTPEVLPQGYSPAPRVTEAAVTAPKPARVTTATSTKATSTLTQAGPANAPSPASRPNYNDAVLADRPVAFWDLNPKASTENDLTGKGNTGTYKNGVPTKATMPNGDTAADFNGVNQYLIVASNPSFSIPTTGELTWEAWIRPDTLEFAKVSKDGYANFMGKCMNYSPTCEWEARIYSLTTLQGRPNRLSAYAFNPGASLGSGASWQPEQGTVKAGEWIHVVGQYSLKAQPAGCKNAGAYPGSIDIWVNGVKWNQARHGQTGCMSQFKVAPKANSSPLTIGTLTLNYWFPGAIGKVAIYNYRLTAGQIANHYKLMTGRTPSGICNDSCKF